MLGEPERAAPHPSTAGKDKFDRFNHKVEEGINLKTDFSAQTVADRISV
jgi:hypothetical protein